jgi:hypothetical protein
VNFFDLETPLCRCVRGCFGGNVGAGTGDRAAPDPSNNLKTDLVADLEATILPYYILKVTFRLIEKLCDITVLHTAN